MAKGDERSLVWTPLRREIAKRGLDVQRFEDKFTPGIPDLNVHIPGRGDVWIELKYANHSNPIAIGLRREQYIWLRSAALAGRLCYLIARAGEWYAWDDIKSWEMAKHPCSGILQRACCCVHSPAEMIEYLIHADMF